MRVRSSVEVKENYFVKKMTTEKEKYESSRRGGRTGGGARNRSKKTPPTPVANVSEGLWKGKAEETRNPFCERGKKKGGSKPRGKSNANAQRTSKKKKIGTGSTGSGNVAASGKGEGTSRRLGGPSYPIWPFQTKTTKKTRRAGGGYGRGAVGKGSGRGTGRPKNMKGCQKLEKKRVLFPVRKRRGKRRVKSQGVPEEAKDGDPLGGET